MTPWREYRWHLLVAVLATLGAVSGLVENPSEIGAVFWFVCLSSGLYNAVLFGVGWQKQRQAALYVE